MNALTARQQRVLDFLREFMVAEGMPPTRAQIAAALGFRSANAAEEHLRALARKGAIEMLPGASRGIRLCRRGETSRADAETRASRAQGPETSPVHTPAVDTPSVDTPAADMLPLVGRVAAGQPILAAAHVEAAYRVDPGLFRPRADYLLRVRGESMRDAGILDGDLLAVHHTPDARNGQIVVARLEDEVTVKRFRRRGSQVQLLAENPAFDPILVDLEHQPLVIEGVGVGVLRTGKRL